MKTRTLSITINDETLALIFFAVTLISISLSLSLINSVTPYFFFGEILGVILTISFSIFYILIGKHISDIFISKE